MIVSLQAPLPPLTRSPSPVATGEAFGTQRISFPRQAGEVASKASR